MYDFGIPDELVRNVADRRVIPFIGAGFSRALRLPGWQALLATLAGDLRERVGSDDVLPYDEIAEACEGDLLQIAEYLFLKAGGTIGPLRHSLEASLRPATESDLLESTSHVELVNLGAERVYTTNYDDLLERTYRALSYPVEVVSLAQDVAGSGPTRPQIVKYHGDLSYEETLVLTESQYYTRLQYETALDVRFRSDIFGRSVLFIGYGFRDINIRLIWFRLMQMLKDVPLNKRRPSYIVRFDENKVLDALYEPVGLRSIPLDREGLVPTAERSDLVAAFLTELAQRSASRGQIPATGTPMFVTVGLLRSIEDAVKAAAETAAQAPEYLPKQPPVASTVLLEQLKHLTERRFPDAASGAEAAHETTDRWKRRVAGFLPKLVRSVSLESGFRIELARWIASAVGPNPGLAYLVADGLMVAQARQALLAVRDFPWHTVWASGFDPDDAEHLLRRVESEIAGHEGEYYVDHDVAYAVDVAHRIQRSLGTNGEAAIAREAAGLLERAARLYPSTATYQASDLGRPRPESIVTEITEAVRERAAKRFEESLADGSADPATLTEYASFLAEREQDLARADEYFRRALDAAPADPEVLYSYASFLASHGDDVDAADRYFSRAAAARPDMTTWIGEYARFLTVKKDDRDRAEHILKEASERYPSDPEVLLLRARFLADERSAVDEADAFYARALELTSADHPQLDENTMGEYAYFLIEKADALSRAEPYVEALEDPELLALYARKLAGQDSSRAEYYFRRALKRAPRNAGVLATYALVLAENNETATAAERLSEAAEIEPNNPWILLNYAELLFCLGRDSEALECTQRARKAAQEDAEEVALACAFYEYANGPGWNRERALRDLKLLVSRDVKLEDFDPNLPIEHAKQSQTVDEYWLETLAAVVVGKRDAGELDEWSEWQELEA